MLQEKIRYILLLISIGYVHCDNCFTQDFGDEYNEIFLSGTGVCGVMSPWLQRDYSSTTIENFHPDGFSFVMPQSILSCISSIPFSMANGGLLQLNVYMYPRTSSDQIRLLAYEGNTIVGQITSSLSVANFVWGWNTLNLTVAGSDNFEGYVAIVGRKASNSDILVDSIRYLPPSETDDIDCPIYAEDTPEEVYECIEYDFESDFDTVFNNEYYLCPDSCKWTTINDDQGTSITPDTIMNLCCTSSQFFNLETNGTLEINIIGESLTAIDFIMPIVLNENNAVIGDNIIYPNDIDDFAEGQYKLEIPIDIREPMPVQVVFLGMTSEASTLLIESLKFTPLSSDGKDCTQFRDVV